jgi:hypothetical protein
MRTQVEVACISKKESKNHSGDTKAHPKKFDIELEVPYDPNSVYFKLSGGTNLPLQTINQEVATMFEIGQKYMVTIEPIQAKEEGE